LVVVAQVKTPLVGFTITGGLTGGLLVTSLKVSALVGKTLLVAEMVDVQRLASINRLLGRNGQFGRWIIR